jgi:hypothetical protein
MRACLPRQQNKLVTSINVLSMQFSPVSQGEDQIDQGETSLLLLFVMLNSARSSPNYLHSFDTFI